jgi:hypothetical protein
MRPAAIAAILVSLPLAVAGEPVETRPYVTLAGAHSHIENPEQSRITTEKDLTALWLRHVGRDPEKPYSEFHNEAGVPDVDFGQCMVVAVFAGRTTNAVGVYPASVAEDDEKVVLRFAVRSYQSGPKPDEASPFGVFVLKRSRKPLVLEQGHYTLDGAPTRWEAVAHFPALEE